MRVLVAACELTDADAPLEEIWADAARRIEDGRTTLEAESLRVSPPTAKRLTFVCAAASVLASGGSVRVLALVTPAVLASEMFKTPVAFAG